MSSPIFSTPGSPRAHRMDVQGVAPRDLIASALILSCSVQAGDVEGDAPVVRVPFVALDDSAFVPEGEAIPEAETNTREVIIATGKIATLVPVSREQYGQATIASLLSDAVRMDMVRKANKAFLAQPAPTAPAYTPPAGILAQPITNGGTLGADLDELIDAVATIENAGGRASHILANPTAWSTISKLKKAADSNESLVGAGTTAAARQLLSLPILTDRDVPANTIVVLDHTAILSVHGPIQVAVSHEHYFNRDTIGVRATWRFGQTVADPARIVKITLP
ncbi:phage major capsid protein [Mycobacteroides abscessus]|uniref:phage major capsid protein n=1 Tax=Mycobacteroides abscessus TaxID=36809 RepID=UPI0009A7E1F0|nr:phage major capsid protein [Mycobacteroides abscessus]